MKNGIAKIGNLLFPENTKRRFFLGTGIKLIKNPALLVKVFNFRRIKNVFIVYKEEGLKGVINHYRLVEEVEYSRLYPFAGNKYDIKMIEENSNKCFQDYEEMSIISQEEPEVTIIIPAYNQFEYTYYCIDSIIRNSEGVTYEIVIADDCSNDVTIDIEKIVKGIIVVRNETNLRFLRNCNNAASHARGKYIVFLNNDTQVQSGWLEHLLNKMKEDEEIGLVGAKLIYADGWLQEAGGIVWKDASAWNYGNRKNPNDAEYNYVKETDYISGAAIMIRKSLWNEIGGFDERYAPAYYEDTDLAFEVRKRGYKVIYQPLSVVVHFEGMSNGKDTQTGIKSYQVINQNKFFEKWKEILNREHYENGTNVFLAKDRSQSKKHILVIDHYVPHYDKDAGGRCTYMYLALMVKMGFQVTFLGDNFYKHEPYTTELNQMGIEVLYGNYYFNHWEEWLKDNLQFFDYVYLQRPHISIKYIDLIKQYSTAKILYFAHDLHHVREQREYELTGDINKLKSAENWKNIELELFEKADVGHVVGTYEQAVMQSYFPEKPIRNIPLYFYKDVPQNICKNFEDRKDLLYVGGFGHKPNVDAVLWFAKEILPEVIKKYPGLKWHVVGSKVPEEIENLASDNIIIHGFLSDEELAELYRSCRMAIVPLRVGAGVKGKVVESAYYQIPLITTSIGGEGLDTQMGNMVIEDDAEKMAERINNLYVDYVKLQDMSNAGNAFIQKYFTEKEALRVLELDISAVS